MTAPLYTFRRNTHTREGVERVAHTPILDALGDGLYHWLSTDRGMTFAEWRRAMEEDDENWPDGSAPSEVTLALALVGMLEAGVVEMVPAGWDMKREAAAEKMMAEKFGSGAMERQAKVSFHSPRRPIDMSDIVTALLDRWIFARTCLAGKADDLDCSASFSLVVEPNGINASEGSTRYYRGPLRTAGILLTAVETIHVGGWRFVEERLYAVLEKAGWWVVSERWATRTDEAGWKEYLRRLPQCDGEK